MFPEASYSFDGTETPLPQSLGKCIKLMQVPVVIIKTHGAFLRDPLYNNLQKRQVDVSADVKYVLSKEDTKTMSAEDINNMICAEFSYDHFKEQFEKGIKITEPFRADGLHRALYKCPCCKTEGKMLGLGTTIKCNNCNKSYELTELGKLKANDGETEFEFVTDWYKWERECVKEEIENNTYYQKYDVDILALSDTKSMYKIGDGVLEHTTSGFELNGCDNKLHFSKKANTSYSLYADYFWYELGDMISIGDTKVQYYCFPKDQKSAIVAKARLATEELFKLTNKK
ncbi:MAG: hypothetical protein MJ236_06290 [Clostridia bacterium]|nr:hypothetical protein [Clostridia bacterium]